MFRLFNRNRFRQVSWKHTISSFWPYDSKEQQTNFDQKNPIDPSAQVS